MVLKKRKNKCQTKTLRITKSNVLIAVNLSLSQQEIRNFINQEGSQNLKDVLIADRQERLTAAEEIMHLIIKKII